MCLPDDIVVWPDEDEDGDTEMSGTVLVACADIDFPGDSIPVCLVQHAGDARVVREWIPESKLRRVKRGRNNL